MNHNCRVLHTVNDLSIESGGPSKTIKNLVSTLNALGIYNKVLKPDKNYKNLNLINMIKESIDMKIFNLNPLFIPSFYKAIHKELYFSDNCIIHDHGIWLPSNYTSTVYANECQLPLVISTHGMLSPWAKNHKSFKKKLAWNIYQRKNIKKATIIHATSSQEADHLKSFRFNVPIVIIPNGVKKKDESNDNVNLSGKWLKEISFLKRYKIILFVGRVHQVKGLMNLLKAWNYLKPCKDNFKLVIAGPSEDNYKAKLMKYIISNNFDDQVEFLGTLEQGQINDLYKASFVLALPSFTENFGMVVPEALRYGVPIITTTATPWSELVDTNAGWYIPPTIEGLVKALNSAINLSPKQREEMSISAEKLSTKYLWDNVGKIYLETYKQLL